MNRSEVSKLGAAPAISVGILVNFKPPGLQPKQA